MKRSLVMFVLGIALVGCAQDGALPPNQMDRPDMLMSSRPNIPDLVTTKSDLIPEPDLKPTVCMQKVIHQEIGKGDQVLLAVNDKQFLSLYGWGWTKNLPATIRSLELNGTVKAIKSLAIANGRLRNVVYSEKWNNFLLSTLSFSGQGYENGTIRLNSDGSTLTPYRSGNWAGVLSADGNGDFYGSAGWSVNDVSASFTLGEIDNAADFKGYGQSVVLKNQRCNFIGGMDRWSNMLSGLIGTTEKRDSKLFSLDVYYVEDGKEAHVVNLALEPGAVGDGYNCAVNRPFVPIAFQALQGGWAAFWRDKKTDKARLTYFDKGGREDDLVLPYYGNRVRRVVATPNYFVALYVNKDPWNPEIGVALLDRKAQEKQLLKFKLTDQVVEHDVVKLENEMLDLGDNTALAVTPDGQHIAACTIRDFDGRIDCWFVENTCP